MTYKKVLAGLSLAISLSSAPALADAKYGMAGCGLGSLVFTDPEDNEVMWKNLVAALLNNFYGNNTFGMTSGTSNCKHDMGSAQVTDMFIEGNLAQLKDDGARASGESIANLSVLLGCQDSAVVGRALQSNYSEIFSAEKNQTASREAIKATLKSNVELKKSCSRLG